MRSDTSPKVIRNLNARTEQICDELATVETELIQLQARQEQLEPRRRRLERAKFRLQRQTHAWNFNRKLDRFLDFPQEIREVIHGHCFPSTETFAEGCKNTITLVSQQVRDEVIDWLGRYRPLVLPLRIKYHDPPDPRITFRHVKRRKLLKIPSKILGCVRLFEIRFEPVDFVNWRFNVISGQVKLIEQSGYNLVMHYHRKTLELLGAAVIREGLGLMVPHLKWVISAFTAKKYKNMETRLHREVETRLSLRWLENLPFSDCDAKEFMDSETCLSLEDESRDDWADILSRH